MRFKHQSMAVQFAILILGGFALIFGIFFFFLLHNARALVRAEVQKDARQIAHSTQARIELMLTSVQKVVEGMTLTVQSMGAERDVLKNYLRTVVENNADIYGSVIAFEPDVLQPGLTRFCPYYCKQKGALTYVDLAAEAYDYVKWDWYTRPRALGQAVWGDPYFDQGGGDIMLVTCSVPFYDIQNAQRIFRGVATADITLDWLKTLLDSIPIYQTGYAFLMDSRGRFIAHPDAALVMKGTIFSLAEQRGDAQLEQLGRRMLNGESGFVSTRNLRNNKESFMYFAPLRVNNWVLGVVFPREEVMEAVEHLGHWTFLVAAMGVVLLFVLVFLISHSVTRPLRHIIRVTEAVAAGRVDEAETIIATAGDWPADNRLDSPHATRNEIQRLGQAVTSMIGSLKKVVFQLHKSAEQVAGAEARIRASGQSLETAITDQAAAVGEVDLVGKRIFGTVRDLAHNMEQVTQNAAEAARLADGGVAGLADMKSAGRELMDSASQLNARLALIHAKTSSISQMVALIIKIANQTNQLSLNAAMEADKAGEFGVGFAAVSREIRRLADQTAVAALDMDGMVTEMRSAVTEGVGAVQVYSGQVQINTEKILCMSGDLERILERARGLSLRFKAVNHGMQAQAQGARQIQDAIRQLNEIARLSRETLMEFKAVTAKMSEAVRGLQNEAARLSIHSS